MHVIAKMNFVAFHVARPWQCDPGRVFFPSRVLIFAAILCKVVMYVAAFLKMRLCKLLVIKKIYGNTSRNKIKKKPRINSPKNRNRQKTETYSLKHLAHCRTVFQVLWIADIFTYCFSLKKKKKRKNNYKLTVF